MKRITFLIAGLLALVMGFVALSPDGSGQAEANGNGAPSGAHETLNIIGVPSDKKNSLTNSSGSTIFVDLEGTTKILLGESGEDTLCTNNGVGTDEFDIIDRNGTDGEASFCLPAADTFIRTDVNGNAADDCTLVDPDEVDVEDGDEFFVCGSGVTVYSVFARGLGGGSATMVLCGDELIGLGTDEECSTGVLTLDGDDRPSKFQNATAELLYLYDVCLGGDDTADTVQECEDSGGTFYRRIPLFSDILEGYFWNYDNNGLKLAQLRFYWCSTTVTEGAPGDPVFEVSSDCDLTGNGN